MTDVHDPEFVEKLFDEMAGTYEAVNYLSSFGFSKRWREQFVQLAKLQPGMTVCDLMCGMGECWPAIQSVLGSEGTLIGLDLSQAMLQGAEKRKPQFKPLDIRLYKQDALHNSLPDACADCVISGFGLKTFSDEQKFLLAGEINRLLKPGGTFTLIEVSVPTGWWLEGLYMLYLKNLIPVIGQLLLGNPKNYRMLGVYTEKMKNCQKMGEYLKQYGLHTNYHTYFWGCASGVSGYKPKD